MTNQRDRIVTKLENERGEEGTGLAGWMEIDKAIAIVERALAESAESDAERLKKENQRLREAQQWRLIETAPKDETVLTYSPSYGIRRCPEGLVHTHSEATHWMPLPEPPAQEGE